MVVLVRFVLCFDLSCPGVLDSPRPILSAKCQRRALSLGVDAVVGEDHVGMLLVDPLCPDVEFGSFKISGRSPKTLVNRSRLYRG